MAMTLLDTRRSCLRSKNPSRRWRNRPGHAGAGDAFDDLAEIGRQSFNSSAPESASSTASVPNSADHQRARRRAGPTVAVTGTIPAVGCAGQAEFGADTTNRTIARRDQRIRAAALKAMLPRP